MKHFFVLGMTVLALAEGAHGQTVGFTDPVGFFEKTLTDRYNFLSTGLANAVEYNNTLNSDFGRPGAFLPGEFDQGTAFAPQYYLEIAEGPSEGARIDIIGNSSDQLTVVSDRAALFATFLDGQTRVVIRRHRTLEDIFGGDGSLVPLDLQIDAGDAGSADRVMIWTGNGFDTYFYSNFTLAPGWTGPNADEGRLPVPPGIGLIVEDTNESGNVVTQDGHVKVTRTLIDLFPGYNLICSPVALDRRLSNFFGVDGIATATNLKITPGAHPGVADKVLFWNGSHYESFFYDTFFLSPGWRGHDKNIPFSDAFFIEIQGSSSIQVGMDFFDEENGVALP